MGVILFALSAGAFSILERIDVGETLILVVLLLPIRFNPFSILERIDVGETRKQIERALDFKNLSVSSNGSTWVKH